MNAHRPVSIQPLCVRHTLCAALCAIAFLVWGTSLHAGDHLSYTFGTLAKSAGSESGTSISFAISADDDGKYSATYTRRENVRESLADVRIVEFERTREVPAAEAQAFFASLPDAGLWKLPKGDNVIRDESTTRIDASVSARDLHQCFNSAIKGGARKTLHAAVLAFAKKLGMDRPEDAAKAVRVVEGDRTPAREIPFSALITNPSRYHGKRIAVTGYYHGEFECSALVPEKFDWGGFDFDREFWVGGSSKFAKGRGRWKNDTWVRIEGVFSAEHGGHMGVSPGEINRVSKFTPLDGPPKPVPAGEDDPHDLEKLSLEIIIQPFPMDGRPIQEVVAALNKQIAAQLAERRLPEGWLKIDLDPASNPKARTDTEPEKPATLRRILRMLGARVSPGEKGGFPGRGNTYMFLLPDTIRLCVKTSSYPDDKEPISFHDGMLGKHAVHVKLVRHAGKWGGDPETFRVSWTCDVNPGELHIADALALIRRIVPDEPGAKTITGIGIDQADAGWVWSAGTGASKTTSQSPSGIFHLDEDKGTYYGSPLSTFEKRGYVSWIKADAVNASPKWNFDGAPPLDLDAAIRAARAALDEIPNAKDSLQLESISLAPLDASRCAYQINFGNSDVRGGNSLTIPVLLSGKAITPKHEAR